MPCRADGLRPGSPQLLDMHPVLLEACAYPVRVDESARHRPCEEGSCIQTGQPPENCIEPYGVEESANTHGPSISPRMYRRSAVPALSSVARLFRDAGTPFVFIHCGGNVMPLVTTWMDLGVNGLIPVDAPTSLEELCRRFPGLALIGGIHRGALKRSPEELSRHVRGRTGVLHGHRRAIPSDDAHHAVISSVSWRNMKLYVRLLEEAARARRS